MELLNAVLRHPSGRIGATIISSYMCNPPVDSNGE